MRAHEKGYESYADMLAAQARAAFDAQWSQALADPKNHKMKQEAVDPAFLDYLQTGKNPPPGYADMTEAERLALYKQTQQYQNYQASLVNWENENKHYQAWLHSGENPPPGMEDVTEAERLAVYQQTQEYKDYRASMAKWSMQKRAEVLEPSTQANQNTTAEIQQAAMTVAIRQPSETPVPRQTPIATPTFTPGKTPTMSVDESMANALQEAQNQQILKLLEWRRQVVLNLANCSPDGAIVSAYIQNHRTRLSFKAQSGTDAFYWFDRNIYLNPASFSVDTPPDDPRLLGIVAEEVTHLSGVLKLEPFSVYGELRGWQVNNRVFTACSGIPYGAPGSGIWENESQQWDELTSLDLNLDRANLERAGQLMKEIGGLDYHIDLLPLYPPQNEIWYDLKQKNFNDAWKTIEKLLEGLRMILK